MKKTVIFLLLLMFCASGAFAAELADVLASTNLSAGVSGKYFSNSSSSTSEDATAFFIETANAQGTKVYSTANFVSDIYFHDFDGDTFVSNTDLTTTKPSSFDSSIYSSGWDKK